MTGASANTSTVYLHRRTLLRAATAAVWVPLLRPGRLVASPTACPGFSLGVASFDPTHDGVLLWTRADAADDVRYVVVEATDPDRVPDSLAGLPVVAAGQAVPNGDRTFVAEVTGLEPGRVYWYQFVGGGQASAVGRTRTAPLDASRLRIALTSCHDYQQGFYAVWRDIAAQDLDLVLFVGDYIYEYESYLPTDRRTWPRIHVDARGEPVGEAYTLEDYRQRYRLYRSDPDLQLAHRLHPFVCVWDDHEVAGDRWTDGAVNHGDNEDPDAIPYAARAAAGVQAYFEYLPARGRVDPRSVYRRLRWGELADLILLDSRTFRSEGVGGTNRNFNPISNIDEPGISDPDRTILGAEQKAWLKAMLRDAGDRWKLIGNQLMMAPLNLVTLPDALGALVAELTAAEGMPVTYHPDGLPVNTDQWDGYQPERRELLGFLRGDEGGGPVHDVVVLSGDIHTGWVSELYVEQGDAPVRDPVAVEFVCPGISSENFNERLGMLSIGRPFPHGSTNVIGPAALANNRHVRYVDFDSNGYVLVEVTPERVVAWQRVLGPPLSDANPVEDPASTVRDATLGAFEVRRGTARLLPHVGASGARPAAAAAVVCGAVPAGAEGPAATPGGEGRGLPATGGGWVLGGAAALLAGSLALRRRPEASR